VLKALLNPNQPTNLRNFCSQN